ncbi:MAG: hypothetical protein JJT78_12935 [Leptospira sp.]|nr:hypothetical protein [Leptospira sp.]
MKFNTPKIDPKKALGSLDGLANKVPDDIAKLIKKIAISLFVFFLIIAAYYGWTAGYGDNSTEGLKLAEDTKSLFKADIEKEYNRKRKNIRLSDVELDISRRVDERMIRDEVSRSNENSGNRIIAPNDKLLTDDSTLYEQRSDSSLPSVLTPKQENLTETIPGRDESSDTTAGQKVLDREDKLKRLDDLEKAIEKSGDTTRRLEKTLDKLENLEKRTLVKPQ